MPFGGEPLARTPLFPSPGLLAIPPPTLFDFIDFRPGPMLPCMPFFSLTFRRGGRQGSDGKAFVEGCFSALSRLDRPSPVRRMAEHFAVNLHPLDRKTSPATSASTPACLSVCKGCPQFFSRSASRLTFGPPQRFPRRNRIVSKTLFFSSPFFFPFACVYRDFLSACISVGKKASPSLPTRYF